MGVRGLSSCRVRGATPLVVRRSGTESSQTRRTGFEPSVPRRARGIVVVSVLVRANFSVGRKSSRDEMSLSGNLDRATRYRWFESGFLQRRVRSLTGSNASRSRGAAFRAGVRAMGGGAVGRDGDRPAIWRLPATMSLQGQIPVPQCQ